MSSFSNAAYNYDTHLAVAQSPEHRQNDGSLTVNPLWHEREPSFIDSLHRYATSPHPPSDWSARTGVMDNERHRFFSASDHKEFVNGSPSMANIECNQVPLKRGPGISKLSQRIDNIYASWEKSGKITSLNHEEMAEIATALAIRQYGSKYAIEIGAGLEYKTAVEAQTLFHQARRAHVLTTDGYRKNYKIHMADSWIKQVGYMVKVYVREHKVNLLATLALVVAMVVLFLQVGQQINNITNGELHPLQDQVNQLSSQTITAQNQISSINNQLISTQLNIGQLGSALGLANNSIQTSILSITSQTQNAQSKLEFLQSQLATINISALLVQANQLNTTMESQNEQINTAETKLEWINSQITSAAANITSLKNGTFTRMNVQTFSIPGQYVFSPSPGLVYAVVEVVGGGGGSVACPATDGSVFSLTTGGGGGGYARKVVSASSIGFNHTVMVGSGGIAVPSSNILLQAGAGGTSSFGSFLHATGGAGGWGQPPVSNGGLPSAAGGMGIGGDVNASGAPSTSPANQISEFVLFGVGGGSVFGGGGAPGSDGSYFPVQRAVGGSAPGGGASGCALAQNQNGISGAVGGDGIVIVTEYIS